MLLIACTNSGDLLMARTLTRRREMVIRTADDWPMACIGFTVVPASAFDLGNAPPQWEDLSVGHVAPSAKNGGHTLTS